MTSQNYMLGKSAFERGFVKAALAQGLSDGESLDLLKAAMPEIGKKTTTDRKMFPNKLDAKKKVQTMPAPVSATTHTIKTT